jgi:hypothetical protein
MIYYNAVKQGSDETCLICWDPLAGSEEALAHSEPIENTWTNSLKQWLWSKVPDSEHRHFIHKACLVKWAETNGSCCPVCRGRFRTMDIDKKLVAIQTLRIALPVISSIGCCMALQGLYKEVAQDMCHGELRRWIIPDPEVAGRLFNHCYQMRITGFDLQILGSTSMSIGSILKGIDWAAQRFLNMPTLLHTRLENQLLVILGGVAWLAFTEDFYPYIWKDAALAVISNIAPWGS